MGEYRYAVVELPPSPYARDLQEVLAFVFDIGVNLAGCTGEQVVQAFMASGLAEEFEKQNPVYVAGKSSYDLLRIMVCSRVMKCPRRVFAMTGRRTSGSGGCLRITRWSRVAPTGPSSRPPPMTRFAPCIGRCTRHLKASLSPSSTRCAPSARRPPTCELCARRQVFLNRN